MTKRVLALLVCCGMAAGGALADDHHDANALVKEICVACHNPYTLQAGLDLMSFDAGRPELDPVVAEALTAAVKVKVTEPPAAKLTAAAAERVTVGLA